MKYIITENRLNNFILNWMDNADAKLVDYPSSPRIHFSKEGNPIMSYDKRNGYVSVSYLEIGEYLHSLFNLDREQMEEIIKIWLETRYGLEPRFVEFKN
jgi:hypothetical protein